MKANKLGDFLNSRWVELAKEKGAEKKVRAEFHHWLGQVKDTQLARRARQLWDYFNSGRASNAEKLLVVAALLYLISPVDLVPDWIPGAGLLDDLGVAAMVLDYVLKRIDADPGKKSKGKKGKSHAELTDRLKPVVKAVRKMMKK